MMLYSTKPACWAPGLTCDDDWKEWLAGRRSIEDSDAMPPLAFTPPLFRRRLSQLSRMTVQVVHDALELAGLGDFVRGSGDVASSGAGGLGTDGEGCKVSSTSLASLKQAFVSFRGELGRQLSINRTLIEEHDVLPAAFSLSVFNTPMALASIACKLKGGYSVLYPSDASFADAFKTAVASLLCGDEERLLFVYADERIPDEYASFRPSNVEPLAFAFLLSADGGPVSFELSDLEGRGPAAFLRLLLKEAYG